MNAKNDIILELNRSIDCYREEAKQLRQEIHDNDLQLRIKALEILRLLDVNELQHGSWMLCEQINKEEVEKLKARILTLESQCALDKVIRAHECATMDRIRRWNFIQALVAKLFRL